MARRVRKRDRLKWSLLYTFSCTRPTVTADDEQASLDGPGYSRIIHCNQPQLHKKMGLYYTGNHISTTRYNFVTFLPKALFEQFRRVANIYFLLAAMLSLTPISPFTPVSMIAPLAFVVGLSMMKEALEDWKRFIQDMKVNRRRGNVHRGEGQFVHNHWQDIRVGDVVKVEKDKFFPADLLLLSSSYEDGICYVETMNLDGETNLKVKRSLEVTLPLEDDEAFKDFKGTIKCEDPNPSLYTFVGNFEYERQVYVLDPSQILLRDSKLRNTSYIYGVVIFTGHDSKVMQNATDSPCKRSRIERKMDSIIYILFSLLVLISLISSIGFAILTKYRMPNWWFLQPNITTSLYDPSRPVVSGVFHLVTALILYGYLIPISLYVSIEVVKVLQATFINQDVFMYDEEIGKPARARTSNLNEELGQVDTILSDKTGTLTCNQMDFLKCSIAGISYGLRASEVEIAAAKQIAAEIPGTPEHPTGSQDLWEGNSPSYGSSDIELEHGITCMIENIHKPAIKGFSFQDDRLMHGNWTKEPTASTILLFFRILALCHTAIPEANDETGGFNYEAESPDEAAFLVAAREFGFEFFKRTQSSVFIREKYSPSEEPVEREFKILNLLEFNSKRKRMSVILRDENGQIVLLCKGADSIIFDRLSKNGKMYESDTSKHLNEYGEAGLRTLALAYRVLDESEYSSWNNEFLKAKTTIGADREAQVERVSDMMERELILVGATAVEDKLQKGVPQCIDKLAQAGLKIWVLTGDKLETAINIGFACSLLRQGMRQIHLSIANIELLTQDPNKEAKENLMMQLTNASQMIKLEKDPYAAFALIIDGKTLTYALEDDLKNQFLSLAVDCASVICCRVSPRQKALVTRLVKEGTGKVTLAIGDGANDVGMIQEADIGVGISGVEGMQAVMASDFSISQFRFLQRLLVVHGHWCYKRIALMICYFFYKNIAFGLTIFYYEAYTGFSGQSVYDDWYMLLFNVVLTSLPVITLGVFEQDVSSEVCLQFPALYQQGTRDLFFGWYRIIGWMFNGLYSSIMIHFLNIDIFYLGAFRAEGQTPDMAAVGATMFTCIIWAVNVQISLIMSHFTWIQILFVWGSVAAWYLFLLFYGMLSPVISGNAFQILQEALGSAPTFWTVTLLVTAVCNIPYLLHISFQTTFNPLDHHVIQEIKHYKKDLEDQHMWKREKSKARQKTLIGFTARVDAKIRQIKGTLQRKVSSLTMQISIQDRTLKSKDTEEERSISMLTFEDAGPSVLFGRFTRRFHAISEAVSASMSTASCAGEESDECRDDAAALRLKLVAIAGILAAGVAGVALPLAGRKRRLLRTDGGVFVCAKAFAAGVILATGFVHMLHDAQAALTGPCLPAFPWRRFPFPGFVAMAAALVTLLLDFVATQFYERKHLEEVAGIRAAAAAAAANTSAEEEESGITVALSIPQESECEFSGEKEPLLITSRHSHSHNHSLGHGQEEGEELPPHVRHVVVSQILEMGIISHSVIVGLSLGVSRSPCTIRPLVAALSFHQFFEGFALGGCISEAQFSHLASALMACFFAVTTPAGIAAGAGLASSFNSSSPRALMVEGLLDSVSAGILIYMALVDLIAADLLSRRWSGNVRLQVASYAALFVGAGAMSTLAIWA